MAPKTFKLPGSKPSPSYDDRRGNSADRGYDHKWRKRRLRIIARDDGQCQQCKREGKVTLATCVDHIIPHRGDRKLFEDDENCESLCETCHNKKTARGK